MSWDSNSNLAAAERVNPSEPGPLGLPSRPAAGAAGDTGPPRGGEGPHASPARHLEVVAVEGQGAADERVQDDAEAPDVHLGPVVLLALEQLRGGVRGAPAERVQLRAQRELVAEAEVGDLDVGLGV